jgi:hypothetical protein
VKKVQQAKKAKPDQPEHRDPKALQGQRPAAQLLVFPSNRDHLHLHAHSTNRGAEKVIPTNRLVALLTPVFTAVAAVGTAWLGKHFPGLPVPTKTQVVVYEGLGASAALGSALKWLHGHQKYEAIVADTEQTITHLIAQGKVTDPSTLAPDGKDGASVARATSTDAPQ